uniref:DUF4365 domain-containing protein n=1 Tax=Candidatus Electronema sp. TaxID=2698783 RepID=UPI004055B47A
MKAQETNRTERRGICITGELFEALGFAFREQPVNDYGIDAHAELIKSEQATGQLLALQIKSGVSYLSERDRSDSFVFRPDQDHVDYWLKHALPVLVCLCDVEARKVYWQIVNNETATSTGKGYKIIIPPTQLVDSSSIEPLRRLLTPVVPATRYTIFKTEDVSHGTAKRYSFAVVINGTATKAEVAAIVRQVTNDGAKRRYYRNHLAEGRWGDSDAHVVWTFIFPTAEDYSRTIWICRSLWISENLEEQFRPIGFKGENIGDNIVLEWSSYYDELSKFLSEKVYSKEQYLSVILPMVDELKELFKIIESNLFLYKNNQVGEEIFISESMAALKRVRELYREGTNLPSSTPFECQDVSSKFQSFISLLDNISIYYDEESLNRNVWSKDNRLWLSIQQLSEARKKINEFEYELLKIR